MECLGDGVCTNPRCPRHGVRPVDGLRDALEEIASYQPAQQALDIDNADCAACKQAEVRQWPPSGLCEDHYHARSELVGANARERASQHGVMRRMAREALDAHPAEPAGVSDEAVAALGKAWDDGNATGLDGYVGPNRGAGDVDPEAVRARELVLDRLPAPFLQPQVVASRPTLDREAVDTALIVNADSIARQGNAIMRLVRPLPTREQISEAIFGAWLVHTELRTVAAPVQHCDAFADAVLALMGGAE